MSGKVGGILARIPSLGAEVSVAALSQDWGVLSRRLFLGPLDCGAPLKISEAFPFGLIL